MNLERCIEKLMECRPLTETEVRQLCDNARDARCCVGNSPFSSKFIRIQITGAEARCECTARKVTSYDRGRYPWPIS